MRPANREQLRRASATHRFLGIGRVRRTVVGGEVVSVSLDLIDDEQTTDLAEGDEFATLLMTFDPFGTPP